MDNYMKPFFKDEASLSSSVKRRFAPSGAERMDIHVKRKNVFN